MSTVSPPHIRIDDRGVAWIDDTNIKVIEIALDRVAYGLDADAIHREMDGYLSLAQIHAALTFYYDHQSEFDREIERQAEDADRMRALSMDSPGRQRLRTLGRHP